MMLKKLLPQKRHDKYIVTAGTQTMLETKKRGANDEQALLTGSARSILDVLIDKVKVGELLKTDKKFIKQVIEFALNKGGDDVFNYLRFSEK